MLPTPRPLPKSWVPALSAKFARSGTQLAIESCLPAMSAATHQSACSQDFVERSPGPALRPAAQHRKQLDCAPGVMEPMPPNAYGAGLPVTDPTSELAIYQPYVLVAAPVIRARFGYG